MAGCSLELVAAVLFACEVFLSIGAAVLTALVPSAVGGVCASLLCACGVLGLLAAQTVSDLLALLRVACALLLAIIIMFFVVPHVEELANGLIDAYLIPRLGMDADSAAGKELRQTLHFGEDALLCVFVAMVCAGWVLFSTVYWTHVRHGRVAERALRRFLKATPAIPWLVRTRAHAIPPLAEPLLGAAARQRGASGTNESVQPACAAADAVGAAAPAPTSTAPKPSAPLAETCARAPCARAPSDGVSSQSLAEACAPPAPPARGGAPSREPARAHAPVPSGNAAMSGQAGGAGAQPVGCGGARCPPAGAVAASIPCGSVATSSDGGAPAAAHYNPAAPASASASDAANGCDEGETCAICICPLEQGEPVRVLACRHPFHKECIDRWVLAMQLAADCPLCKRALLEDFV